MSVHLTGFCMGRVSDRNGFWADMSFRTRRVSLPFRREPFRRVPFRCIPFRREPFDPYLSLSLLTR
ncbi:hypothetical protein HanIR_Chr12g0576611 [Helianthus annuus]|nr:hypothetical protein HanIR_Chr12g0576611 [Helianthus annuus]